MSQDSLSKNLDFEVLSTVYFTKKVCMQQTINDTRRKKSDYNSKNTSHAFVAGFVLAILVKKLYILSRDPFMLKMYQVPCF